MQRQPEVLPAGAGDGLRELVMNPQMFLDRTTVIYGPSGSGKTIFVKDIMHLIRDRVEQVVVVAPTDQANGSYSGIVPASLVHDRLWLPSPEAERLGKPTSDAKGAEVFLTTIWERQVAMARAYRKANDRGALLSLFRRLRGTAQEEGRAYVELLDNMLTRTVANIDRLFRDEARREKLQEIRERHAEMLARVYKQFIERDYDRLWRHRERLSKEELFCLQYLRLNPRMVLVFDDCAAELKSLFSKDFMRRLFYQGRWGYLTTIVCCQDDTDLPANLRKNAFVSIFTDRTVCTANFDRGANNYPRELQQRVRDSVGGVFVGNRKMAYIRIDPSRQQLYHVTAQTHPPFRFGSQALWDLCARVETDEADAGADNRFAQFFEPVPV